MSLPALASSFPVLPTSVAGAEPYRWSNVAIQGGGFVTGLVFHPTERGLLYARTDVGGAYRRDVTQACWVPLMDWVSRPDWNLHGIESLALDPTDPERVYAAAGTYINPQASNGELLRSTDRGLTWERTPLPFPFGGNEAGRGNGERLMVDPHAPHRLLLGTRRDGVWESGDHGATWRRVPGFPDLPDAKGVGVVWVRFDPSSGASGAPTPVIYAGVSRPGDSVWRSTDAGVTWAPVPGQPTPLRPTGAALAPDGTLYITYADEAGPTRMGDGAVWRFRPVDGRWDNLSPEKPAGGTLGFGYAAVCLDPADPQTLLVTSWNRSRPADEIFRSTDGGATWTKTLEGATWDHSSAPYTRTMSHHWMSDVEIDPFDPARVLFTTGYGIWETGDIAAAARGGRTHWEFANRGLEETVPLTLASPPEGVHLISGLGDIDGFLHHDFTVSPRAGRLAGPRFKNTEFLDFAGQRPAVMVRSGTTYAMDRVHAAYSKNGGENWAAFATEPGRNAALPPPPEGPPHATGPVAISADGNRIVWTLSRPAQVPQVTRDWGATWIPAKGAPPGLRVIADRVAADWFYGFELQTGTLWMSGDGGAHFAQAVVSLPVANYGRDGGDVELKAMPGAAGQLWLVAAGQLWRLRVTGPEGHRGNPASVTGERLGGLGSVVSVGFGAPMAMGQPPSVFAAAEAGGDHGLFRSEDEGRTWLRISDQAHRFASTREITGDPRIPGRLYFATGGRGIICGEPHRRAPRQRWPAEESRIASICSRVSRPL